MHALLAATKPKSPLSHSASPVINVLMATVLATGLLFVWLVGCMLLGGVAGMLFSSSSWEQLQFTTAGEPVLKTQNSAEPNVPVYHRLNGERIAAPRTTLSDTTHLQLPSKEFDERVLDDWEWRIHSYFLESPLSFWYLVRDGKVGGGAYFVGFDPLSKRSIGYIGKNGFRSTKPVGNELFPIHQGLYSGNMIPTGGAKEPSKDYWDQTNGRVFLVSGSELLSVDLGNQTVTPIPLPSPPETINMTSDIQARDNENQAWHLLARLPKEVVAIPFEGEGQINIPLPNEPLGENLVLYWPSKQMSDRVILVSNEHKPNAPQKMFWIDKHGTITRREEWTQEPTPPESWTTPFVVAMILPMPAPYAFFSILVPGGGREADWYELTFQERVARRFVQAGPALLALMLISLALAVVAYRRERSRGRGVATSWFFFVLLFGWPAFVGYWLAVEHPIWARGKPTSGSEPESLPALTGIEIFA